MAFLGVGILLQIFAVIFGYVVGKPDNLLSIISGITGIVSVVLCAQGKISFYLFGYIQLFTYVFGVAIPYGLWGEVFENGYYLITMIIGSIIWIKRYETNTQGALKVSPKKLHKTGWIISGIIMIVSTIILGIILSNIHNWIPGLVMDPTPWLDAITTTAPFIAQIFLMLGYREQWAFWIIEDIISLIMFIILGNWVMTAQYLFWSINCIYGWVKWSQEN